MGKLFGNQIDSEAQLKAAQQRTYTPQQEREAKAAGFRNADEALAYLKQRQAPNKAPAKTPEQGFMDRLMGAFSWHPTNTLNRASSALRSANER